MMDVQRYQDLGKMNIGWLDAHYHFSFANYHNPARMGFGPLRVINDDIVKVGGGFDFHPHRDMEIITYVRAGAITHRDNLGNEGQTSAGDVQVMSAGTGIVHAELNLDDEDINLYQIWILPREKGVKPRWEARQFPKDRDNQLHLLVSGRAQDAGSDALMIHQDAAVWGGKFSAGATLSHSLDGGAYLLISEGQVMLDGVELSKGDGVAITDVRDMVVAIQQDSELVLIELPTVRGEQ